MRVWVAATHPDPLFESLFLHPCARTFLGVVLLLGAGGWGSIVKASDRMRLAPAGHQNHQLPTRCPVPGHCQLPGAALVIMLPFRHATLSAPYFRWLQNPRTFIKVI